MLVPGYDTETVNIIRLWSARASRLSFDLARFSAGQYGESVEDIVRAENISKVLYPDDSTPAGRELRLKQQYLLVTCSLRDIIRRFRFRNEDWDAFPAKVVIQLNDTHPVLAITEMMRLLVDEHRLDWDRAWSITQSTFAYTCHTLLPEAMETWPVALFSHLLPRHMEIIYRLNQVFLETVRDRHGADDDRLARLSLISGGDRAAGPYGQPRRDRKLRRQRRGRAAVPAPCPDDPARLRGSDGRRSSTTSPTGSPLAAFCGSPIPDCPP